jgi:hypothetical protein
MYSFGVVEKVLVQIDVISVTVDCVDAAVWTLTKDVEGKIEVRRWTGHKNVVSYESATRRKLVDRDANIARVSGEVT